MRLVVCVLTAEDNRATTIDHLKPKSKGGSSLRSNLIPACHCCNHDKGSEDWLSWYQRQEFYNKIAQECIEEWITNKRLNEDYVNERTADDRATVCSDESEVRSLSDEPPSFGENRLAPA